ncbi:DNA topoisomerase (ATP-hydrolyzing) [Bacteroidia bacterium]|nr:DNA topoisomerase (ATP-hydrolyzing) [Bacteroidia bacterium]GHT80309.1 DNA topoisomerase (ATP-hydrolyzing) [Bacteroidia bacterium]
MTAPLKYDDDSVQTLDWQEHIRRRPGMYIGKIGDGRSPDDGIYVLIKEVLDNSIDEYAMGFGKQIDVSISAEGVVSVRDYGRGVPLGKVIDVASKMNTGAKYDSKAFKKSVGLNGVGIKAVNALSSQFDIVSFRDGKKSGGDFIRGVLQQEQKLVATDQPNGTLVTFVPDPDLFGTYTFNVEYVEQMLRNYTYLNAGLVIQFNDTAFVSKNGLLDLLNENLDDTTLYPPVHLQCEDFEMAFTHNNGYGETYYSFVNGQHTTQGGTHLTAFREAIARTIKDFYKKDFDPADVRSSIVAAVSVKVEEPEFESQTKIKLGSRLMAPNGITVRSFVSDTVNTLLDNYLHKHPDVAETLLRKITENEKERKAISGIQKLARERAKKASLHNKKLRDCRVHYTDAKNPAAALSSLFITEGDSASGSITKTRDVNTQAVFSLRGKPLNCYGLSKKIVYENEEFNLLQAALNIEESLDDLRYNRVIIATDADDDGMHIRLLIIAFFLQFFPDLIHRNHLYILQTPLFRVRNQKGTNPIYCYSDEERINAIQKSGTTPEITRFKGLGEISPDEFREFITEEKIRLDPVRMSKDDTIHDLLEFYMGKNTPMRQEFIVNNLRISE